MQAATVTAFTPVLKVLDIGNAPSPSPQHAQPAEGYFPNEQHHRQDLLRCLQQVRDAEEMLTMARAALAELASNFELSADTLTKMPSVGTSTCIAAAAPVAPPAVAPPAPPPRLPSMRSPLTHEDGGLLHGKGGHHGKGGNRRRSSMDAPIGHVNPAPNTPASGKKAVSPWAARDLNMQVQVVDQVVVGSLQGAVGLGKMKEDNDEVRTLHRDIIWEGVGLGSGLRMQIPMLHPEAKLRTIWLFLGFFFIVYEAYAIPAYLAFDVTPEGYLWYFASLVNSYFLVDIILQFLTGHMSKKGSIITNPGRISRMYMKSWFIPDIAAAFPWEWISGSGGTSMMKMSRSIRLIRAARLLRLMRLMRVMKLKAFMDQIETYMEANYLFTFLTGVARITGLLFAICHWGACVWYAIGTSDAYDEEHLDGNAASWVKVHQNDYPYIGEDKFQHYIFSLYFTLTTMTTVGYGDITPTNYGEVCFCMVLLSCSSVVFAGLMGTLTDMIGALNNQRHELAEKKMCLGRYMRWRAVPRRLKMTIRQHLLFLWDANKDYDTYEEEIKQRLPPVLKAELCNHIYGKILGNAPFFAWMKDYPICTKYLAEKVQTMFLERGDCIFHMGQRNEQIYIMLTGEVIATRNESLFERDEAEGDAKTASTGADPLSFDIPRQGDMTMSDVTAKMVMNQRAIVAQAAKGVVVDKLSAKMHHKEAAQGPPSSDTVSNNMASTPKGSFGVKTTGNAMFDSEVLTMATVELRRQDMRKSSAAKRVQRMWRKRKLYLDAAGHFADSSQQRSGFKISRMTSKQIKAPAYFGESCLWQPLEEWQDPPYYLYTVRCESRGEIIYIPRVSILEMINQFSPWLLERFDSFREAVVARMQNMLQGEDIFRDWGRDFAMADCGAPRDDLGLQELHCQALHRDASASKATSSMLDHPAMPRVPLYAEPSNQPKVPNSFRRGNSGILKKQRSATGLGGPQDRFISDAGQRV